MELSRRSFVQGAVALSGAAVFAGLTGCAGKPREEADGPAVESGGADSGMPTEPIAPLAAPESWAKEVDVVVVGTGGGLAGALRSVDLGNSTVCLEKLAQIGGASKEASCFSARGTNVQLAAGLPDIDEYVLGPALANLPLGQHYADYVTNISKTATRVVNWTEELGFEWQPVSVLGETGYLVGVAPKGAEEGGMTARAQMYLFEFLRERFEAKGGDLMLETTLAGLVVEDGRVIGVAAKDVDGNDIYIKAAKGVLLATGGMAANVELMKTYLPDCPNRCKFSTAGTQDTGEGILMGLGAGAQFDGYNHCDTFDGGINGVSWNTYMYDSAVQIARQPWLGITAAGDRYHYYPYESDGGYDMAGEMLQTLPGAQGYVFFDANYETYGDTFKLEMCRLLLNEETMPDVHRVPEALANPNWKEGVKAAIERGLISSADTVEGVAEALGLDPAKVSSAVADWNSICEAGTDPEGKMPDEYLNPIKDAPFYGMAVGAFTFATHAGLSVDGNAQVLDTKFNPIPGLYACGCTVGIPFDTANSDCATSAAGAFMAVEHMSSANA